MFTNFSLYFASKFIKLTVLTKNSEKNIHSGIEATSSLAYSCIIEGIPRFGVENKIY